MSQNLKKKDETSKLNQIFMIKIRIGTESNCIFLGAPDRILDLHHQKMFTNIDSINDKVYLEFYDVINETGFNPKTAAVEDTSNLKLLALKIFDVRDFAFDEKGQCLDHRILVPVDKSGNVSQFTLSAKFVSSV